MSASSNASSRDPPDDGSSISSNSDQNPPKRQKISNSASSESRIALWNLLRRKKWTAAMEHLSANPNDAKEAGDSNDWLPLHEVCSRRAPSHVIEKFIRCYPEAAKSKNNSGRLPLHLLFFDQTKIPGVFRQPPCTEAVRLVIESFPGAAFESDNNGMLPLHFAAFFFHKGLDQLRAVLSANPNATSVADNEGRLPLHFACRYGHEEFVREILAAYPKAIRAKSINGCLPLHIACLSKEGGFKVIPALIDAYPEASRVSDNYGKLPLHLACENLCEDSEESLLALIEANPVAARVSDNGGNLPLHIACGFSPTGCKKTIVALIDAYPEAVLIRDNDSNDAFDWACKHNDEGGSGEVIEVLVSKNEECQSKLREIWEGPSLQELVKESIWGNVIEYIGAVPESAKELGESGGFPLHSACTQSAPCNVVEKLLRIHPVAALTEDNNGNLPLHLACKFGSSGCNKMLAVLIDFYSEAVLVKDRDGNDPFSLACRHNEKGGSEEIVKVLASKNKQCRRKLREISNGPSVFKLIRELEWDSVMEHIGAFLSSAKEESGSLLYSACRKHAPSYVIEKLLYIDHGATKDILHDLLGEENTDQFSDSNGLRVLKLLLAAYPSATSSADNEGKLPLHLAAMQLGLGVEHIRVLIASYPNAAYVTDNDGMLPLHCFSFYEREVGGEDVLQELIDANPDAACARDNDGCLPLHNACEDLNRGLHINEPLLVKLIDAYPGALHTLDNDGDTPFSYLKDITPNKIMEILADTNVVGLLSKKDELLEQKKLENQQLTVGLAEAMQELRRVEMALEEAKETVQSLENKIKLQAEPYQLQTENLESL